MGYTTEFDGCLTITPALSKEVGNYINRFSNTRRMARDVSKLPAIDPEGKFGKFGTNDYGLDGEFFSANIDGDSVIDYNISPSTQPGLWCQWEISADGTSLEWDGGEKFYCYTEWLEYVIENFIVPAGSVCNGAIMWQGEDSDDMGKILVEDNAIKVGRAVISYSFD